MAHPSDLLTADPADVHHLYAEFRERGTGIHHIDEMGWRLFFRYEDVTTILRNPKLFISERFWQSPAAIHDETNPAHRRFVNTFRQMMLMQDPPVHTRLRGLVRQSFTPKSLERMRPVIEQVTDELLDGFSTGDEIDLIPSFADLIPVQVIADVMGVPVQDRAQFRVWSNGFAIPLEISCQGEAREQALSDAAEFLDYLDALIADRRKNLGDDLVSMLITTEEENGERLTADELLAMISLLLVAGNETTVNLLGNTMSLLFDNPDQKDMLLADPGLITGTVEETLRLEPSFRWIARVTAEDCEIGGDQVPKGTWVYCSVAGANRDPREFDDPETFDITRGNNKHIAFGYGIHLCVGAPLARMEAQIAIPKLLERFPGIRRGTTPATYTPHFNIRHPEVLPVILE